MNRFEVDRSISDLRKELEETREENKRLKQRMNGLSQTTKENEELQARLSKVEDMLEGLLKTLPRRRT